MSLAQFPDENQATLPEKVNRIKEIPLQVSSAAEAEAVGGVAGSVRASQSSTSILQILGSLALQTSLSHLWAMLNSQQMVVFVPMFSGLRFPANASMILEQMIKIATFDLIPTSMIDD